MAAAQEDVGNIMDDTDAIFDKALIMRAIEQAEGLTSGEIRVVAYPRGVDDPVATAREEFARLGMHRTRDRNAVLILVAPAAHAFAIYGDEGIHARCGAAFWTDVAEGMTAHFRKREFTAGIVDAVTRIGTILAQHFPVRHDDENELPDDMIERGTVI